MTYEIPTGYQLIPVSPHLAQIVPISQPSTIPVRAASIASADPTSKPAPKPSPPVVPMLIIGGVLWLLIVGNVNQSGQTRAELERKNTQLTQENLYLRNQVDQLHHQLMGIYSVK